MTEGRRLTEDAEAGPPPMPAGLADERFAVNLREEREQQGLSQADIARQMKERGWSWHPQTVQRVEAGHRKVTIGEAEAIARILRTTAERLTWPGKAASAAGLLDITIGRALSAHEQIAAWTVTLLFAQRQLEASITEAGKAAYYGSDKIEEIVNEARQVVEITPEDGIGIGRQDYRRMIAAGESPEDDDEAYPVPAEAEAAKPDLAHGR